MWKKSSKSNLKTLSNRKEEKKTQMMQMIDQYDQYWLKFGIAFVGIIFYGLILGHHELIFS